MTQTWLTQEAADHIRSAARKLEFTEREIFDIDARFDWNHVFNETNALSLFADKKILELRIASGKPGDKGSKAICELCENLNDIVFNYHGRIFGNVEVLFQVYVLS